MDLWASLWCDLMRYFRRSHIVKAPGFVSEILTALCCVLYISAHITGDTVPVGGWVMVLSFPTPRFPLHFLHFITLTLDTLDNQHDGTHTI